MEIINKKDDVEKCFCKVLAEEGSLSMEESDGNYFAYYDNENDYERHYYFNDTIETIEKRILMDKQVESFLPKDKLAQFLAVQLDVNAIMVIEKMVLLWENDEGMSPVRDALENEYGDEYAQYIADGFLGQTWVDRQMPVINVSSIYETSRVIHDDTLDPPFSEFFLESVLQTIFHESVHLFYDCNELISVGEGTPYPENGGAEAFVEEYGNAKAHETLQKFMDIVQKEQLDKFLSEMEDELC